MSRRALWLACGALSVGFVVVSCTSADGSAEFDETGGTSAGGEPSTTGGTKGKGGTAGSGGNHAPGGNEAGGGVSGEAGTSNIGGDASSGGEMGLGGDVSVGGDTNVAGMPGEGGTSAGEGGMSSGEGGTGGAPLEGEPCESVKQCQEGEYCRKAKCGDSKLGVCVMAHAPEPVCGCDGITYYSGALATAHEVDVRAAGVCATTVAVGCDEQECSKGQTCGRVQLRAGLCESKIAGVCWQLPEACPKEPEGYNVCGKDGCVTLCSAVLAGDHAVPGGLKCSIALP
jgi:hypothetical protein